MYRIYRELELNLRIKPKKRLAREKPEPLVVREAISLCQPSALSVLWTRSLNGVANRRYAAAIAVLNKYLMR